MTPARQHTTGNPTHPDTPPAAPRTDRRPAQHLTRLDQIGSRNGRQDSGPAAVCFPSGIADRLTASLPVGRDSLGTQPAQVRCRSGHGVMPLVPVRPLAREQTLGLSD